MCGHGVIHEWTWSGTCVDMEWYMCGHGVIHVWTWSDTCVDME